MNHNQASMLEHEEVAKVLQTDLSEGLTSFEARERLKKYGANVMDSDAARKTIQKLIYHSILDYLKQFLNPLIQLLFICTIISLAIGEYYNAASVIISVIIVSTISFIQERRSDKSLEKLNNQIPKLCKVVREGRSHEIPLTNLVPGDIIYLSEGQRVPADVRLFDITTLTVNEAHLTGETIAQVKSVTPTKNRLVSVLSGESTLEKDKNFIFQNLALMGTIIESGHSRGIVICTGKATRYGQVYNILKTTVQPRSPLQNNIDQLSIHLVVIACSVIALMSIIGIVQQRPNLEVAYYALSLAVTAIPEGLPVVVAVIMALSVMRLSKQQTIVKSLTSIETLGCIEVLCADKTGTLTRNDMSLTDIVTSELHSFSSSELEGLNNDESKRQMTFNKFGGKMYSIGRLMEVGTLCNNASIDPHSTDEFEKRYLGQATDCAILDAAIRMGFGDSRTKFDRLEEVPFNASTRKMIVKCQRRDLPGSRPMYYMKGAWEDLLAECAFHYDCGLIKPKQEDMWSEYTRICSTLGSQGLRVLALATGPNLDELTFVGIVGINNAPRENIKDILTKLKEYHIDVKMITGDSRATAIAVGRKLELIEGSCEESIERAIMSGDQMQKLLLSDLNELAKAQEIFSKSVFYRVDPIQKASIVTKIQELDKIVAMTGDGVNDVISLKKANLSLVMGSGADVCKEIADLVMIDDNMSVLTQAIVEGKGIYLKIHSFMSYQIAISLSLVILVTISFLSRTEPPFTVIQLLFINILADGPPAQSLGVERVTEKDVNSKPRNVHEPILSLKLFSTISTLTLTLVAVNGLLYYLLIDDGELDIHDKTLLFTCYVFCSVFAAISVRSKSGTFFESRILDNRELIICNIVVVLLQLGFIYFKPVNKILEVEPLPTIETAYVFLYSISVLVIMDTQKILWRLLHYTRKHLKKNEKSLVLP